MIDFQKKGLDKKVIVVRDEAPYFSEALGFSLPCLLVNPALTLRQDLLVIGRVTISCLFLRFVLIFKGSVLENVNVLISKKRAYF